MTKRTLLLSWTIPPETTGSAVIVGNLAKQFAKDELIVAGLRPTDKPPIQWGDDLPPIVYIGQENFVIKRGKRWLRRAQFPFLLLRVLFLVLSRGITSIVTVFPDERFLFIGYFVSRLTNRPFFPYLHNTYLENRKGSALRLAEWLQPRVFEHAEQVFVMSEGMVGLYKERYPELNSVPLVHPTGGKVPAFSPPPPADTPLRLVILGSISESCRDATVRVCQAIFAMENVSLTFITGTPRTYLENLGVLPDGVEYKTVAHHQVISSLKSFDIVLLPHGLTGGHSAEEYRTIFPTRTIEYLLCERPILAHTPTGAFLTEFLQKHQCALIVEEPDVEQLKQAILQLATDAELRGTLVQQALKTAEQFTASQVANRLRSFLR